MCTHTHSIDPSRRIWLPLPKNLRPPKIHRTKKTAIKSGQKKFYHHQIFPAVEYDTVKFGTIVHVYSYSRKQDGPRHKKCKLECNKTAITMLSYFMSFSFTAYNFIINIYTAKNLPKTSQPQIRHKHIRPAEYPPKNSIGRPNGHNF